jgi:hypothetical protein
VARDKVASAYQKKQATAQQAEAVVDALMKVFDQPLFNWEPPRVVVDTWEQGRTVVVWEEGLVSKTAGPKPSATNTATCRPCPARTTARGRAGVLGMSMTVGMSTQKASGARSTPSSG